MMGSRHPADSGDVPMREWTKILISSTLASSLVSAFVSWRTSIQTIELQRWSRQGESAYEALIKANALYWHANHRLRPAAGGTEPKTATDAQAIASESDLEYTKARHKIAAYANASVVTAMRLYYHNYMGADQLCSNPEKFRADVQIYRAIRNTLGVGGPVSDDDLAVVLFHCSLR